MILISISENLFSLILLIEFYEIIIINGEVKVSYNYNRINITTNNNNNNNSYQYILRNTSITLSFNEQWNFHFDMFIIIFLALLSFCANTGLLYLDRCAKSSNTMNNSSFSNNNFISFTNNNNNNNTITTSTNNNYYNNNSTTNFTMYNTNNNKAKSISSSSSKCILKKWLNQRNSHGINCLLYNQLSMQKNPNEITTTNMTSKTSTTTTTATTTTTTGLRSFSISNPPLNKYPSSISLLKLNHTNQIIHHGSIQYHHTPRSRRQRRYLRGLLGLSISNLSLSVCLLNWCICQIILYNIYNMNNYYTLKAWLTIIAFLNIWIIDIAQTLEIGAILWIALERTLGIHWPSETQTSNNNNNNTHTPTRTTTTTINSNNNNNNNNTCSKCISRPRFYSLKDSSSNQFHYKLSLYINNTLKKCKFTLNNTTNYCTTSIYQHTSTNLLSSKKRHKKKCISCFIRIILCFLPFVLFLLASTYSLINIIQQIKKQRVLLLHNNQHFQQQQQQHLIDFISDIQTTYIKHSSSINGSNINNNNTNTLIIGQFFIPLAILVTTNLLIYQKHQRENLSTMPKKIIFTNIQSVGDFAVDIL
ncbi:hypothetical protein MN116_007985 [Schistosoma mekongi]|uniref:Uncharacterized protein n=1 Tax=Schistosoma mekongi TaxID=38744 RepID=A0AAE1Z721_SCHME|nr:hypothetical protein MN116_007985 [Schistosoma mekongi]